MLNTRSEVHDNPVVKDMARIKWQAESAIFFHSCGSDTVATHHTIGTYNKLSIGKIMPLDDVIDDLMRIRERANNRQSNELFMGWNDPRAVFSNQSLTVWQNTSQQRSLWFRVDGQSIEVKATLPRLVFVLNKKSRSLSVFACSSRGAVNKSTRLYVAPLMNTSSNGAFCLGNAHLPENLNIEQSELFDACEACVFNSLFTHTNASNTFRSKEPVSNAQHINTWKSLAKQKRAPKLTELTPSPAGTLESKLKSMLRGY